MLGRPKRGAGFCRFVEGSRPVGEKKKEKEICQFFIFYHRCCVFKCLRPVSFLPSVCNTQRSASTVYGLDIKPPRQVLTFLEICFPEINNNCYLDKIVF